MHYVGQMRKCFREQVFFRNTYLGQKMTSQYLSYDTLQIMFYLSMNRQTNLAARQGNL